MSGDEMQSPYTRITGTVARARVGWGSKSDRIAVVLQTKDGKEYILRRAAGNAFRDPALERLVGSKIAAAGVVAGHTFIVNDWTEQSTEVLSGRKRGIRKKSTSGQSQIRSRRS
jgi:hypothetical protein